MAISRDDESGGLRGWINANPVPVAIIILVLLAAGMWYMLGDLFGPTKIESPSYYTADDGQTLFIDERDKIPPFSAKGGEAVKAVVYRDPDGGEPFALYLMKYKEEMREDVRIADENDFKRPTVGMLYKKPGDAEWVDGDDPANAQKIAEIKNVVLPSGKRLILVNAK